MKKIIAAAIHRDNKIISAKRHADCIRIAVEQNWEIPIRQEEQGFIDNDNIFYNRIDAIKIAKEAKQISKSFNKSFLLSEDLW